MSRKELRKKTYLLYLSVTPGKESGEDGVIAFITNVEIQLQLIGNHYVPLTSIPLPLDNKLTFINLKRKPD